MYGSLGPQGLFTEETPLDPHSPYSASKAAADLMVKAYHDTYGMPVIISRSSNNYGPYQFPEKLLPLMITNIMEGSPLPVYGDGLQKREWLHVRDHCAGIWAAWMRGEPGRIYNLSTGEDVPNLEMVRTLIALMEASEDLIVFVTDRPGHDRRYALDITRAFTELGWRPEVSLSNGLVETVAWYRENRRWWEEVKSGAYREYYARMYGSRELL